jgi:hypothetical protein
MKIVVVIILSFASISLKGQAIDTAKIEHKIKVVLYSYSSLCRSEKWFNTYINESNINLVYLKTIGLNNVSLIEMTCNSPTLDSLGKTIFSACNYLNISGRALFAYDHLTNELFNVNSFNEESRTILKFIFSVRASDSIPPFAIENKESFAEYFYVQNFEIGELFDFMNGGKKTRFNSFNIIKFKK